MWFFVLLKRRRRGALHIWVEGAERARASERASERDHKRESIGGNWGYYRNSACSGVWFSSRCICFSPAQRDLLRDTESEDDNRQQEGGPGGRGVIEPKRPAADDRRRSTTPVLSCVFGASQRNRFWTNFFIMGCTLSAVGLQEHARKKEKTRLHLAHAVALRLAAWVLSDALDGDNAQRVAQPVCPQLW